MATSASTTARSSIQKAGIRAAIEFELHERVDVEKGVILLRGEKMYLMRESDTPTWDAINDTISVARHTNGIVVVQYYLEAAQNNFGRLKSRVLADGTHAVPYVRMKREARAHLAAPYYWDVDMVNCQPMILKTVLGRHSIDSHWLTHYIEERHACLEEVMLACGVDRDTAKRLFIRLLFFGGVQGWVDENPGVRADSVPGWIHLFKDEMRSNAEKLLKFDEFAPLKRYHASRAMMHDLPVERGNKTASIMALYLQTIERECVCALVTAIQYDAREVGGIIYDGVLVAKEGQETGLDHAMIKAWTTTVMLKTSYTIELKVKQLDENSEWLIPREVRSGKPADGKWDDVWMDGRSLLSYAETKRKWEQRSFKVMRGGHYVREQPDERDVLTERQLVDAYRHLAYSNVRADEDGAVTVTSKPFIARWITDPTIRVHNEMVMAPPPSFVPSDAYNIWNDVEVARYEPTKPVDPGSEGVRTILKLIEVLCSRKPAVVKYMLDWMAQMFQQPAKKTGIAILLKGEEGVGKNRLTDVLRLMLGGDKFMQTANPAHTLYGRFTRLREGKLLVVLNETHGGDSFAAQDIIKDMITCDQFVSEGKGTNAYTIGCFSRFMFTSNNDNCLKVNPDSRRYWVIDVSSELKGDATFFNELSAHMDDPHTRHEFYSLLKSRDIARVDWIKDRPITEGYEEMAALNMPYEHQFIKAMVLEAAEQQGVRSLTLDVMRDEFRAWQVRAHVSERQHDTSALKFAHKISKLAWNPERHTGFRGIVKSRDMHGVKYVFDVAELLNEMRGKRWITQEDCITVE